MSRIPIRSVVAAPARDEEARLPILLSALARQVRDADDPLDVVIVLNNCRDGSAAVVERSRRRHPELRLSVAEIELPPDRAHVGEARRIAMDMAAEIAGETGAILTTDADATPPANWVAETMAAFVAGADLVGGRLIGDPAEEAALGEDFLERARAICRYHDLCDEFAALIDPLPHDPWPRHHDHTGASLAVRADVYRRLGGLDPLPCREDLAFVVKARAAGFRLRHPPALSVMVSARLDGRAKGGMADCLVEWRKAAAEKLPVLVQDPVMIEERLLRRAALRTLDRASAEGRRRLLARLGIHPARATLSSAALVEAYAGEEPDAPATTPIAEAAAALVARIADLRAQSDAA